MTLRRALRKHRLPIIETIAFKLLPGDPLSGPEIAPAENLFSGEIADGFLSWDIKPATVSNQLLSPRLQQ